MSISIIDLKLWIVLHHHVNSEKVIKYWDRVDVFLFISWNSKAAPLKTKTRISLQIILEVHTYFTEPMGDIRKLMKTFMIPNKITKSKQLTFCSKLRFHTDSDALQTHSLCAWELPNKLYVFSIQCGSCGKQISVAS